MNVLVITTDAYGSHGGIGLYNRDLIDAIADCPAVSRAIVVPRRVQYAPEAIPEKVLFMDSAAASKSAFLRVAATVAACTPIDLVICGHINLLPVAVAVATLKRARVVLMAYGIDVWRPVSRLSRGLLGRVAAVWSISAVTRERMEAWAHLGSRYAILPNAIHTDRYGIAPSRPDLIARYRLDGRKVVLSLGRLASSERYKGFDEMLDELPHLIREEPRLVYVIGGDGDDLERLKAKARNLGLEDAVVFTGFVEEAEKADFYRLADAFVLAGRGEGFGFVLLEAMACGVPVVASVRDGSLEAVRGGRLGAAVDPDDGEALAAAVLAAMRQPKRVPEGLEYFSFAAFRERLYAELDRFIPNASRGQS